jgi:hypothetical protein
MNWQMPLRVVARSIAARTARPLTAFAELLFAGGLASFYCSFLTETAMGR